MSRVVADEPGYVLHSAHYKETSVILSLFTLNHGVVQLISKGARRPKSPLKSTLQIFRPLLVNWVGSGDLKTLTGAETASSFYLNALPSSGLAYCSGLYINELLTRLLPRGGPSEEIFSAYVTAISELFSTAQVEPALRRFEIAFLRELGALPDFEYDLDTGAAIESNRFYRMHHHAGFVRADEQSRGALPGKHIIDCRTLDFNDAGSRRSAKLIARTLIDNQLQGRALNSREMIRKLMEYKHG
jgi:DNA repair protein RecO (recombination protein O)